MAGTAQVEVMVCSQDVTYPLKAFLGHKVKKHALDCHEIFGPPKYLDPHADPED